MKILVLRRRVMTSDLDPVECADRLRQAANRVPLWAWRPLVGWATRDVFSVRSARRSWSPFWAGWPFPPRASGTIIPVSGGGVEIRVDLGISVVYLVVALIFSVFYLLGALTPGYLASDVILGVIFVLWVASHAIALTRWSRRADRLVEILSSTCEAVVQRG